MRWNGGGSVYKDPQKQREAMAKAFRKRYATNRAFKEKERARKAEWYQANRERLIAKAQARKTRK